MKLFVILFSFKLINRYQATFTPREEADQSQQVRFNLEPFLSDQIPSHS